jgi:hypothetical protein
MVVGRIVGVGGDGKACFEVMDRSHSRNIGFAMVIVEPSSRFLHLTKASNINSTRNEG